VYKSWPDTKKIQKNLDMGRKGRYCLPRLMGRLSDSVGSTVFLEVYFMVALASVRAHWLDDAPSVVVSASWLAEFGFQIGSKVVIEVTQGVITIKPVDCEEEG